MVYFITEKYLKTYTPIGNNVDVTKIDYLINDSYVLVISRLLGYHFSTWLLNKHQDVINGNDTYTAMEERLIDYIQKTMAWDVVQSGVEGLSDYLTNKGAQKQSSDFSTSSSDSQVRFLSEKYFKKFQEYQDVLIDFLCDNKNEFLEFDTPENKDSLVLIKCSCGGNDIRDIGITVG